MYKSSIFLMGAMFALNAGAVHLDESTIHMLERHESAASKAHVEHEPDGNSLHDEHGRLRHVADDMRKHHEDEGREHARDAHEDHERDHQEGPEMGSDGKHLEGNHDHSMTGKTS